MLIDIFLKARHTYGYGPQKDYFKHPNVIGWTRLGTDQHPGDMAVVMSNGDCGIKRMHIGQPNRTYIDATGHINRLIRTDASGWAKFLCPAGSVSVWVPQSYSVGRNQ